MEKIKAVFTILRLAAEMVFIIAVLFVSVPVLLKIVGIEYDSLFSLILFCVVFIICSEILEGILKIVLKAFGMNITRIGRLLVYIAAAYVSTASLVALMDSVDMPGISILFFALLYALLMQILEIVIDGNSDEEMNGCGDID